MMDKFLELLEKFLTMAELTVEIAWGKSHQVWNWLEGKADWLKQRGLDEYRFLRAYLFWMVLTPILILLVSVTAGTIGYYTDAFWLVWGSRFFIALTGVGFLGASLFLWLRMAVIAELLMLAGRALAQVPLPRFLERREPTVIVNDRPTGSQESVERLLRAVMGVMFWLGVLSLYCCYFPVYASPTGFLVVLLIAMTLGFGMYYFKWSTRWSERISLAAIVFMLFVTSMNLTQVLLRKKAIEADIRTQKIYAAEYERISLAREDLLIRYGIKAEQKSEYKEKTDELMLVRAKMKPATVTEMWDWGWAKVCLATGWTYDRSTKLYAKLKEEIEEEVPFEPDPSTMGTVPEFMKIPAPSFTGEASPPDEPSEPEAPAEPKFTDEEKAQAKAALEALNRLETEIKNL
ncbi:MAG: SoxR reducing system RseC family protein [Phycisphaerae bacterium]|nr:SoxR reducing system RseC family protein [Phycisphaerae bacterium]